MTFTIGVRFALTILFAATAAAQDPRSLDALKLPEHADLKEVDQYLRAVSRLSADLPLEKAEEAVAKLPQEDIPLIIQACRNGEAQRDADIERSRPVATTTSITTNSSRSNPADDHYSGPGMVSIASRMSPQSLPVATNAAPTSVKRISRTRFSLVAVRGIARMRGIDQRYQSAVFENLVLLPELIDVVIAQGWQAEGDPYYWNAVRSIEQDHQWATTLPKWIACLGRAHTSQAKKSLQYLLTESGEVTITSAFVEARKNHLEDVDLAEVAKKLTSRDPGNKTYAAFAAEGGDLAALIRLAKLIKETPSQKATPADRWFEQFLSRLLVGNFSSPAQAVDFALANSKTLKFDLAVRKYAPEQK